MKKIIICTLILFASPVWAARYNNSLPSCEELGYSRHNVTASTQAIFCPFDSSYSVILDNSYRGYVEKSVLDAEYAAYGKPEQFCELETVTQGEGNSQKTLYRCKKCKTQAFEAGLCVEFCDVKKFPYSSRPEDLYGTVIECKDNNGKRYAYSSCNNGWTMDVNGVRCEMDICDRDFFPYEQQPDGTRGIYTLCKSATNTYYGYKKDSCNSEYEFKAIQDNAETGICYKRCAISNCRFNGTDENGINDYKCDLPEDCQIGDVVTYNNINIGWLLNKARSSSEHNLILALTSGLQTWGGYGSQIGLTNTDNGKQNTKRLVAYAQEHGVNYPAAQYAYNYSVSGITEPALAKHEWFLLADKEAANLLNTKYTYILMNQMGHNATARSSLYILSSMETQQTMCHGVKFSPLSITVEISKSSSLRVYPMLAI